MASDIGTGDSAAATQIDPTLDDEILEESQVLIQNLAIN